MIELVGVIGATSDPCLASTFDDVTLFYLVEREVGTYFGEVIGRVQVDRNGANWWSTKGGNQKYITLLPGAEIELADVLTDRITGEF